MSSWKPSQLPMQIADAFALLYDWFEESEGSEDSDDGYFEWAHNENWRDRVIGDPKFKSLKQHVSESGQRTPQAMQQYLNQAAVLGDVYELAYSVYVALHAIDQGLVIHQPNSGTRREPGMHHSLSSHYARYGYLNTLKSSGYVLPKRVDGIRSTGVSSHFINLVRADVDRRGVPIISNGSGSSQPSLPFIPTVVVVPFLYDLDEVEFEAYDAGSEHFFRMTHQPKMIPSLKDRVQRVVKYIRASGAHLALLPELALEPELLATLRSELASVDDINSDLRWVIVGSFKATSRRSNFPYANAAYVLDGGGNEVRSEETLPQGDAWVQLKRNPYTMTHDEQVRYSLDKLSRTGHHRCEAISIGRKLFVFEGSTGRFAVLICEDLSQEKRSCERLREMNCTVVFVLVMDGPVVKNRWVFEKSEVFIDQTGVCILVANSLLLPRRLPPRAPAPGKAPPCPDDLQPVGLFLRRQASDGESDGKPSVESLTLCAARDPSSDASSLVTTPVSLPFPSAFDETWLE